MELNYFLKGVIFICNRLKKGASKQYARGKSFNYHYYQQKNLVRRFRVHLSLQYIVST